MEYRVQVFRSTLNGVERWKAFVVTIPAISAEAESHEVVLEEIKQQLVTITGNPRRREMSFIGSWRIVSSPDFDDDYLREEAEPYVKLKQSGDRIDGEYHVGYQSGEIDGRLQSENQIIFSFAGMDEMDEVNGAGTITMNGDKLIFKLMYHMGDDYTFECKRDASSGKAKSKK